MEKSGRAIRIDSRDMKADILKVVLVRSILANQVAVHGSSKITDVTTARIRPGFLEIRSNLIAIPGAPCAHEAYAVD
jgi:hypothetical protein